MSITVVDNRKFQPGDLIGFSGRELVSRAIKALTVAPCFWLRPHWRSISHIGICAEYHGRVLLFESTTLTDLPCIIRGVKTAGVQAHLPDERIDGYHGFVFRARLSKLDRLFRPDSTKLTGCLLEFLGAPYDMLGAILSGTPWPTDSRQATVFCDDLCALMLRKLGRLQVGNSKSYSPASLLREVVRTGVYQKPERVR